MMDNTHRFDGRSGVYSRSRPSYPGEIIKSLRDRYGLRKESVVADIGSGTGKLSLLFLENGNSVYCIEPNGNMREEASVQLAKYGNATLLEGTAENTGLEDDSVDLVVAGQAFHWFDIERSRVEFKRILKDRGIVALIWNDRVDEEDGMNADYERICAEFSNGYHLSGSSALDGDALGRFFSAPPESLMFGNFQKLDLEGLKMRYFSSSYSIGKADPGFSALIGELEKAFQSNEQDGFVYLKYNTRMFVGRVD